MREMRGLPAPLCREFSPGERQGLIFRVVSLAVCLAVVSLGGCATLPEGTPKTLAQCPAASASVAQQAGRSLAERYPPHAGMTLRGVVTVWGKQFACDGFLTRSSQGELQLALMGSMGVLAQVRWSREKGTEVLRTARWFRRAWVEKYVSRDLELLFGSVEEPWRVRELPDGRAVLSFDSALGGGVLRHIMSADGSAWLEAERWEGRRRRSHAACLRLRPFPGSPQPVPAEFRMEDGPYTLDLAVVDVTVKPEGETSMPGRGETP